MGVFDRREIGLLASGSASDGLSKVTIQQEVLRSIPNAWGKGATQAKQVPYSQRRGGGQLVARWADLREQGLQLGARAVGLARMDDLHDKLPAAQKRVADVLALPDGNGCVSHVSDSKTWRDDERGETRAGSGETGRSRCAYPGGERVQRPQSSPVSIRLGAAKHGAAPAKLGGEDKDERGPFITKVTLRCFKNEKMFNAVLRPLGKAYQETEPGRIFQRGCVLHGVTIRHLREIMQIRAQTKAADVSDAVATIVKKDPRAFLSLSVGCQSDRNLALIAARGQGKLLEFFSPTLRNDTEVVLAAVRQCGASLQFASHEIREKDRACAIAAVTSNPYALKYVLPPLCMDEVVAVRAVSRGGWTVLDAAGMRRNKETLRFKVREWNRQNEALAVVFMGVTGGHPPRQLAKTACLSPLESVKMSKFPEHESGPSLKMLDLGEESFAVGLVRLFATFLMGPRRAHVRDVLMAMEKM